MHMDPSLGIRKGKRKRIDLFIVVCHNDFPLKKPHLVGHTILEGTRKMSDIPAARKLLVAARISLGSAAAAIAEAEANMHRSDTNRADTGTLPSGKAKKEPAADPLYFDDAKELSELFTRARNALPSDDDILAFVEDLAEDFEDFEHLTMKQYKGLRRVVKRAERRVVEGG